MLHCEELVIDLAVRPRIGDLIPRLTDQFIAFTISSERAGFVQRLKQAAGGDVQFLTVEALPMPEESVPPKLLAVV